MNAELTLDDIKDGAVYTINEAAHALGISYNSVRNAIDRGDLGASRVGGIRILGKDVKTFWEKMRIQPKEKRQGAPSPRHGEYRPLKHIRLKTDG